MKYYKSESVVEILKDGFHDLERKISESEHFPTELFEPHKIVRSSIERVMDVGVRMNGIVSSTYLEKLRLSVEIHDKIMLLAEVDGSGNEKHPTPELKELNELRETYEISNVNNSRSLNIQVVSIKNRASGDICAFGTEEKTVEGIMRMLHRGMEMSFLYEKDGEVLEQQMSILRSYYKGNLFKDYEITINDVFDITKQEQKDAMYQLIREIKNPVA